MRLHRSARPEVHLEDVLERYDRLVTALLRQRRALRRERLELYRDLLKLRIERRVA